jgi:hypothetical protein
VTRLLLDFCISTGIVAGLVSPYAIFALIAPRPTDYFDVEED